MLFGLVSELPVCLQTVKSNCLKICVLQFQHYHADCSIFWFSDTQMRKIRD